MKIIRVTKPYELFSAFYEANKTFGRELWWRGQACLRWDLVPSVYRAGVNDTEKNLAARFIQKAPSRYPNCPEFNNFSGWLFLMQHHRLPTRLLDWSESPLIASYFAMNELPGEDSAIWALDPFKLNGVQFGTRKVLSEFSSEVAPLFAEPLKEKAINIPKIAAINSIENNLRMLQQLSKFTISGTTQPLNVVASASEFLIKIEVSSVIKSGCCDLLYDLGIRSSNLFPDLDNLTREIISRKNEPA